jgi:thiamine pyrophosphate-dependent acetolactate synthase large subunit-like protein
MEGGREQVIDQPVHEVVAAAFVAEGVDTTFALMGNGNMHWLYAMAKNHAVRNIHVRHEHCAVAMAEGYARATGRVGVATVSAGPAYTQIMTALSAASRARMPLVVLAGEAPIHAPWHSHRVDQPALTTPTGARYIQAHSVDRLLNDVREAFHIARVERLPVVLGIPEDIQNQIYPYPADYQSAADLGPAAHGLPPAPEIVDIIVDMIASAQRPIVLAGRGAVRSGAGPQLAAIADQCGALLATSLYAKGLFDDHPYAIGIAGAYATTLAREQFAECDLVIGVGAGLGHYTTEGGYLYANAKVVQIDIQPRGLWQGVATADLHLKADAAQAATAIVERLRERGIQGPGLRTETLARRLASEPPDPREFPVEPDTLDPRMILDELDNVVPKDWDIVCGSAHFTGFAMTVLRGRRPERYHIASDFGAIGQALPNAIGVAAARRDGKVLLIEGDGSLLMHAQELDTIRRHGLGLLICVMNDGGFGAESQKLRAQGLDPSEAIHGRGQLADVARAFGLRGQTVTSLGSLAALFDEHDRAGCAELWDLHIDDKIPSPQYSRLHFGQA